MRVTGVRAGRHQQRGGYAAGLVAVAVAGLLSAGLAVLSVAGYAVGRVGTGRRPSAAGMVRAAVGAVWASVGLLVAGCAAVIVWLAYNAVSGARGAEWLALGGMGFGAVLAVLVVGVCRASR